MNKNFDPGTSELKWYEYWEEQGYFKPHGIAGSAPYSIMIPPPNVTGSLHMGHAFQQTIMDALIRYQRMMGKNTLWQVGTDHAGIATQMVVERKLANESGTTRHDLGRDAFIDKIWDWKAESGGTISRQMRRLGNSVDWQRERFTMDDGMSAAVMEVFVSLYEQGLIYRGKRLVNWDPVLHTAISDLEVENKDQMGSLWHFHYPLCDGALTQDGLTYVTVATTRPETMLGDTAVAVNPDDERYQHLVGGFVELPIVGRRIPIVSDDYVDPEFGTGCVKITPAHDFNDYALGQRHQLPLINVLNQSAEIADQFECYNYKGEPAQSDESIPADLVGLDRFVARKQILAKLETLNLLGDIKPHAQKTPHGDRSGSVIEPLLTDQWYVRAEPLAKPAIEAVETGKVKFVPQSYENMYFAWMRDIQDWCISRQLWWGHRIPAWYDQQGNHYVGRTEQEVRDKYQLGDRQLSQDEDVLDTWFSSALWTFSTLGWPQQSEDLQQFHPSSVLVTGFDIIFFWVARMMMMTLHFKKEVPFHTVYVTGLIRDENGQKMSKSKGNVIDPLDMIDGISLEDLVAKRTGNMMQAQLAEKIAKQTRKQFPEGIEQHGTDALRFTLCALASTGRDINWDMTRLEGYRNFCNKLWNASRYVLQNVEGEDCGQDDTADVVLSPADKWIQSEFKRTCQKMENAIQLYRFDLVANLLYEFIWNQYCDWYLELSKPLLWDDQASPEQKRGTRQTLVRVLESTLRLAHPVIPFITEEIWQRVAPLAGVEGNSIMVQPYPTADSVTADDAADQQIIWLKAVTLALRNIRGELNIKPSQAIPVWLRGNQPADQHNFDLFQPLLRKLVNVGEFHWLQEQSLSEATSSAFVDELELLVPMAGLIDLKAERSRLNKELDRVEKDLQRVKQKLDNPNFTGKAPADVVEKERERCDDLSRQKMKLSEKLDSLRD